MRSLIDRAGVVTFVVDTSDAGNNKLRFGIPRVTRHVRKLFEVTGDVIKDGNHYVVQCDISERSLLRGIVQRLIARHAAYKLTQSQFLVAVDKSEKLPA